MGDGPRGPREPYVRCDRSEQAGTDSRHPVQTGQVTKRAMGVSVGDDNPRQGRTQVGNPLDLPERGPIEVHQFPAAERP